MNKLNNIANFLKYVLYTISSAFKYKSIPLFVENCSVIHSSLNRQDYFETINIHITNNYSLPKLFVKESNPDAESSPQIKNNNIAPKKIAATYIHTKKNIHNVSIFDAFINCGWNTGNNAFGSSVSKHIPLDYIFTSIDDVYQHVDYVNNHYDALLVTPANIIANGTSELLCEYYESIKIPLIPMSIGIQARSDISELKNPKTKRLMHAISEKSNSIGVRCHYTADYLNTIGIQNVDVIGCPSFYLNPSISCNPTLNTDSQKIAVNFSIGDQAGDYMDDILEFVNDHDAAYISQCRFDHFYYLDNPKWQKTFLDKFNIFFDPNNWVDFLKQFQFSFGCRLHGNIMALNSGIPALFIAHDLRLKGVIEYMKLPYENLAFINKKNLSTERLRDRLIYNDYKKSFKKNYHEFLSFLEKSGVPHHYPSSLDLV